MRVVVTGGSGVVGRAVVRHLVESGVRARAVVRSDRSSRAVEALGAEPVQGDVLDQASLGPAFAGAEVVYHLAGVNETCSTDPDHMYRVNVEGTRTVLRAAADAGVQRLVHTSSAVTMGERRGQVANEETPHRGTYLTHYERSKRHAELVMLSEASPVEVVVVNPSSVQGPGRATGTGKLILDVVSGRMPVLVESQVSIVDVDDCARGHLLAAERGRPGERYLLSGFTMSVSEAVAMAGAATGRDIAARMVPMWLATAGATAVEVAWRLLRRRPPICRETARLFAHGHVYDGSKAGRELGLAYTPAADTFARLIEWYRSEGLL